MPKKKRTSRNMMYTQQIEHLPQGMTTDAVLERIKAESNVIRFAFILHDKDVDDEGKLKPHHIHLMMQFKNARSAAGVASLFNDRAEQVTIWDERPNNGFAYLIHATERNRHKHQYSCSEVIANFDYTSLIEKEMRAINRIAKNTSNNRIDKLLDLLAIGEMTVSEVHRIMSGSEYASASAKIERAHALYLERAAEKLHNKMKANNEVLQINWLYGISGTGKTHFAKDFASKEGSYYITTAHKDPFEFYQAQPIIIIDELRPETIQYSELLSMFNPFSYGDIAVSSRYHNKRLACRVIFITTPFSPKEFYKQLNVSILDSSYQLYRRLSAVLRFDMSYIYEQQYNYATDEFIDVKKKRNNYSELACVDKTTNSNSIFNKIPGDSMPILSNQDMLLYHLSSEEEYNKYTF